MDIDLGPTGRLAKVIAIEDNGLRVYFELRGGLTSWFDQKEPQFGVGDVIHISGEVGEQRAQKVSDETWPEDLWVGVVKVKLDDITIVDSNGHWRIVPNSRPSVL